MIEKRNIAKDTIFLIDKRFFWTFQNEKSRCLGIIGSSDCSGLLKRRRLPS